MFFDSAAESNQMMYAVILYCYFTKDDSLSNLKGG